MKDDIAVSIICNTYNHEKFIKATLDGFLMQKTSFKYEVLIHDDASTDGTAEIIREYEEKHPEIIKPICQSENHFSKHLPISRKYQYPRAKGKYFAFCEGDDCWTCENKLQLQYDYMESHPSCSMTCHNSVRYDFETGKSNVENPIDDSGIVSPYDIICQPKETWIATASIFARAEIIKNASKIYQLSPVGDYAIRLMCLSAGDIYYDKTPMSIYNYKHPGSWSSGAWKKIRNKADSSIVFLEEYNKLTGYRFNEYILQSIKKRKLYSYLSEGNIKMLKSAEFKAEFSKLPKVEKVRAYLKRYAPFILTIKHFFDK